MRFYLSLILFFSCLFCSAQGFRVRHYLPAAQNNTAKAIYETASGNYIAIGIVVETYQGHSSNRLCVMGLGSEGQLLWTKKYGNYQFEYLDNILISRWAYKQNNHLYYTCCVKDSNNKYSGVLLKFDLNGDTLWQKIYRDPVEDVIPQRVTGSVDGGFLITGFFQNETNGTNPCLLIKTNANGDELWRKKIHKSGKDVCDGKAIIQDTVSKKIIIGGYQYIGNSNSFTTYDHILIIDSLGNNFSRHNYTSTGGLLTDLIQTKDKKIVAVGWVINGYDQFNSELTKSFAVKFDFNASGAAEWTLSFDKTGDINYFTGIQELQGGNLIFSGSIDTINVYNKPSNYLTRLTKVSAAGIITWNGYYNYKANNVNSLNIQRLLCINPTSDHGFIGAIENLNASPNPFFFVKYDADGCDSTLAYCAAVAAGIEQMKLTDDAVSIYPNPAHDHININIKNTNTPGELTATIFDVYGREIKQVPLSQNKALDLKNISAGVYLLKISNNRQQTLYQTKLLKED